MKASHPWTQLSWSNEHKVLSRTLSTLVSEVAQFYVSSSSGAAGAGEGGESFVAVSKEFERKRFASLAATRKALSGFKNDLKLIKSKQQHSAGNVDPVLIKELLENFESKLTAYKSAMRRDFDALVSDLGPTEEEVRLCLERSSVAGVDGDDSHDGGAAADQQQQQQAKREKAKQDLDKNLQMQTQVGLLDRQIQELGGRYGHWDPRDHDVFMRVWNQTPHAPNQPEGQQASSSYPPKKRLLCRKLVTLLSDKTDVECEEHFDWYVQYTALLERKKKLLGEWKGTTQSERERERRAILAGQIAAEGGPGDSETSRDGSNSHSHSHAQSGRSGQSGHSEAEAQRMRHQVERWKQSRAEEQAARAQEEREQELREQQLRQERARKRQQEARLQLDKWKADEAVIKQLEALELSGGGGGGGGGSGSPRRRTSVSTADIESNAARDLEIAKRRREEREAKEKKASLRETRLKDLEGRIGSAPSAPRDPARLLADTVTTGLGRKTAEQLDLAERRRASSGAHSSAMALSARDLTHGGMRRAMPVWTRPGV